MANTPQSKKRARQSDRRQDVNKARRSRIRTFLRKVEEAIASGSQEKAAAALKAAQPELARGVTKGILHKNTLARKMSRLTSPPDPGPIRNLTKGAPEAAPFFVFFRRPAPPGENAPCAPFAQASGFGETKRESSVKFCCPLFRRLDSVSVRFTSSWGDMR